MSQLEQLLGRIDVVLRNNQRLENVCIACMLVLFGCGIASLLAAIASKDFLWATPSVITTALLKWPLERIIVIRRENIALATAPAIIQLLPHEEAARELQQLIQRLYDGGKK